MTPPALLIIEIQNFSNALLLLDDLSKIGELRIVHYQKALGGRLITMVLNGELSLLNACKEKAQKTYQNTHYLKVCDVIANPGNALKTFLKLGGQS